MSRGPGIWQRAVLAAVEAAPLTDDGIPAWVDVVEVTRHVSVDDWRKCPHRQHLTWSELEGIRRAMRTLAKAGKVDIGDVIAPGRSRTAHFVVAVRRPLTDEQCAIEAGSFTANSRNWREIRARGARP